MTGPYKSRPILIVLDVDRLRQQNKFIFLGENFVGRGRPARRSRPPRLFHSYRGTGNLSCGRLLAERRRGP
jgi:hypothetical protein